MNSNTRQRGVYVTARQKKKLIELLTKHPELITCKVTQEFNYKDSQKLWATIASECNSIPGARKTWRQWRKTWQDLRSNTKKKHAEGNGELPSSIMVLTRAEQEALGLKNVPTTCNNQGDTGFMDLELLEDPYRSVKDDSRQEYFMNSDTNASFSDVSQSTTKCEEKVRKSIRNKICDTSEKNNHSKDNMHTSTCVFNCNILAQQELRKINMKEDYLNFKKDYLTQKLKLLKEQTETLRSIAKELCNK